MWVRFLCVHFVLSFDWTHQTAQIKCLQGCGYLPQNPCNGTRILASPLLQFSSLPPAWFFLPWSMPPISYEKKSEAATTIVLRMADQVWPILLLWQELKGLKGTWITQRGSVKHESNKPPSCHHPHTTHPHTHLDLYLYLLIFGFF